MNNLKILLKHLEAVKTSPWSEAYVKEMVVQLQEIKKRLKSGSYFTMHSLIDNILG